MKPEYKKKNTCAIWLIRGILLILGVVIVCGVTWFVLDDNPFGRVLKAEPEIGAAQFSGYFPLDVVRQDGQMIIELGQIPAHISPVIGVGQKKSEMELISVSQGGEIGFLSFPEMAVSQTINLGYQTIFNPVHFYADHQKLFITAEKGSGARTVAKYDFDRQELIELYVVNISAQHIYSIDSNGDYIIRKFRDGILIYDEKRGATTGGSICLKKYRTEIDAQDSLETIQVTIDDRGDYVSILMEYGDIVICPLSETATGSDIITGNSLGKDEENRQMLFSPTRAHFAWLTDEKLVLWRLGWTKTEQVLELPIEGGHVMAFDRTGEVLFIGSDAGLLVLDVRTLEIVDVYSLIGSMTSVFITWDNRLLIWGDADGNVHLWGVPLE
jgi:hypothetical protein